MALGYTLGRPDFHLQTTWRAAMSLERLQPMAMLVVSIPVGQVRVARFLLKVNWLRHDPSIRHELDSYD